MKHRIQNPEFRIQKIKDAGGATPTAGDRDGRDPRKVGKGGKWGVGRRLETCFREKWLCSITRIYTHLHAFTQSFWRVTLMWKMEWWSGERRSGVMEWGSDGVGRRRCGFGWLR